MSDKEALQEIVFMVNDYVNFTDGGSNPYSETTRMEGLIDELVSFLEENVIHCSMDNNYK